MSKLDVYLRSIEKFGASGAVLTSGQPVMLKFPTGDRHATQVTPHDQLVALVREVAPPAALDQIDAQRPARFEVDSQGIRYSLTVQPRPGAWQVSIDPAAAAPAPAAAPPRAAAAPDPGGDMLIERGQYDGGAASVTTASGSTFLDQLTTQARGSRATDIFLATGSPPILRAGGQLVAASDRATDADLLSRELGIVAPAEARAAWTERGAATFAYGDGAGRVRATLGRDERGPRASLRLLHGEGPPLERLGLGAAAEWLEDRGLIVVAGPSGAGKTTTLAALVRALGDRRKMVVTLEDPIEILHAAPSISQRAVGNHVASFRTGVGFAMREGADAIVIGSVTSKDGAAAVIDALAGGHLVLTTLAAPTAGVAIEHMLERLPEGQRDTARALCTDHLLGTVTPVVAANGARTFEVSGRGGGS
jgi:twitching motility protein PilT